MAGDVPWAALRELVRGARLAEELGEPSRERAEEAARAIAQAGRNAEVNDVDAQVLRELAFLLRSSVAGTVSVGRLGVLRFVESSLADRTRPVS